MSHFVRLDFEDTYDGLGDQLDETDDALNDDTFGGGETTAAARPVGKDFDFFGQTAKVADAINEEQLRFSRHQPAPRVTPTASTFSQPLSRPARTGYERYKEPDYVPDMQVDHNLWGVAPKKSTPVPGPESPATPGLAPGGRKMMSLEEVEAAMRAQAKKSSQVQAPPQQQQAPAQAPAQYAQPPPQQYQNYPQQQLPAQSGEEPRPAAAQPPVHILQRSQPPSHPSNCCSISTNPNTAKSKSTLW